MKTTTYENNMMTCLSRLGTLLGGQVRPFTLEWGVRGALAKQLRLESRHGLGGEPPLLLLEDSRRGHCLDVGVECYRWETEREGTLRIARVEVPFRVRAVPDFWVVRVEDVKRFYRAVRREVRRKQNREPPIMTPEDRQRLWANTIGFLRRGQEQMQRYGVPAKRGVALLGEPGNGKTMAARWLESQCYSAGLQWRCVTEASYEEARADRQLSDLFQLGSPGIVLFDDFDSALRDRQRQGTTDRHATFLSELDGVRQKTGVVYLFTSNLTAGDLDPAMRRPGRIDLVLHFRRPSAPLRRRVITERWHADIVDGVDVREVVDETDGMSFAEIEEAKKLLVMHFMEHGAWEWSAVCDQLSAGKRDTPEAKRIGFGAPHARVDPVPFSPLPSPHVGASR